MSPARPRFRRYLIAYFAALLPFLPLAAMNVVFLVNTGEIMAAEDIVERQIAKDVLFGAAISPNVYRYKLALYGDIRPRVVAVGSSRVMQLRAELFSASFANMGGAMNSLLEGAELLRSMLAIHKPEVMILGLDFWWFDEAREEDYSNHRARGNEISADKLLFPLQGLYDGRISPAFFFREVFAPQSHHIGLNAALRRGGYAKDGSRYYLGGVLGRRPTGDYQFGSFIPRARAKPGAPDRFAFPARLAPRRLEKLREIVDIARNHQVRLVVFAPPIAGAVLDVMAEVESPDRFGAALNDAVRAMNVPYFDMQRGAQFGAGDCEFIDGQHGGDVAYARILLKIADDPRSGLGGLVDRERTRSIVENYSGFAMFPNRFVGLGEPEQDFLGLGCQKKSKS